MLSRSILKLVLILAGFAAPATAAAQSDTAERERLERRANQVVAVLKEELPQEELFTDAFNAAVPEATFRGMLGQMEAQMGPLVGLERIEPGAEPGSATIYLRFEQAIASGPMQLEAQEPYEIAGLRLVQFDTVTDGDVPVLDQVRALPGAANLLLAKLDGSQTLLEHNAEMPLALGSTFKLYVLSTLVQQIAAGERAWDDVVALDQKSYPSGILQDWPAGTPLTLQTLATLMISISDNTATDQLIAALGREAVEAELRASGHSAPELNLPFMTTREMFVIKTDEDVNIGEYASLGTPERLAVLESLQERKVALDRVMQVFGGAPRAIEVEWFASPRDIARIFDRLKDDPVALAILGVNTAIGEEAAAAWDFVGFKGGSEPGVVNMSWLLRDDAANGGAGDWYVLTLGWNTPDEAVGPAKLLGIARSALATINSASE